MSPTALGGLSPQGRHAAELAADALHRALTAARRAPARRVCRAARRVGSWSRCRGGVDSAVAALREREAGNEVVAVTLKLWADQRTDGERSCCSPQAVLGARALAHSLGHPAPDDGPRGAVPGRGRRRFLAGYAAGRTPNPCVRCNGEVRIDAMVGARRAARRARARRPATTRGSPTTARGRCSRPPPTPPRTRPTCSPRSRPGRSRGCASRSADLTKPEVRRDRRRRRALPSPASARARTSASSPARAGARSSPATAASRDREGEIVDRRGRVLGRHRGHHRFTVGQRRGIGVAATEPLYVLATDAARTGRRRHAARSSRPSEVALRDAVLHRDGRAGGPGPAPLPLARRSRAGSRARRPPRAATTTLSLELARAGAGGAARPDRRADGRRRWSSATPRSPRPEAEGGLVTIRRPSAAAG